MSYSQTFAVAAALGLPRRFVGTKLYRITNLLRSRSLSSSRREKTRETGAILHLFAEVHHQQRYALFDSFVRGSVGWPRQL